LSAAQGESKLPQHAELIDVSLTLDDQRCIQGPNLHRL
jgi:hypothetical protein